MEVRRPLTQKEMIAYSIEEARQEAYQQVSLLNRKERRTARGRMLEAQAEAKACIAELAILREWHTRLEQ